MNNRWYFPAMASLAAVVLGTYFPLLTFPLNAWPGTAGVMAHAAAVLGLFAVLVLRTGLFAAFSAALLFGVFPGHALSWAVGGGVPAGVAYVLTLGVAIGVAVLIARFNVFLRTQEKLVQYIFRSALAVLAAALVVMSSQINSHWRSEESLWRWRAAHGRGTVPLNMLAEVLRKKDYAHDPQLPGEIIALYEKSLQADPRQVQVYYRLADFHQTLGKRADAIAVYERILNREPGQAETYFYLAAIYEQMDQPKRVIELFNALLKLYPEEDKLCLRILNAYSNAIARHPHDAIYQEKREELLAQYEQLSKRKKYSAGDFFNLGLLYEQVGGFEEATRFYRKALDLQPNHEKSLLHLAGRYQASGDPKAALALYERYIHFYPRATEGYLRMGILLNALGEADKAGYFYRKVINIDGNNADAFFYLGYLNESAGELREALSNYEKAVDSNPQYAEAYYNMGNVYAAMAQYPEAIASYLKTVAINPKHQNAFVNLSILSFKSRDFQGAIRYLQEAERLGYVPPEAYLKTLEPYRKK